MILHTLTEKIMSQDYQQQQDRPQWLVCYPYEIALIFVYLLSKLK